MLEQLKQYVASTRAESIMPAAQRISEALNIRLDEVLAAIEKLGSWDPAAALAGEGTLTVHAQAAAAHQKRGRPSWRARGLLRLSRLSWSFLSASLPLSRGR
jgi:hypothetical protein